MSGSATRTVSSIGMLIYRRNSLHSRGLARNFIPDLNPRTGRLSINGFLA